MFIYPNPFSLGTYYNQIKKMYMGDGGGGRGTFLMVVFQTLLISPIFLVFRNNPISIKHNLEKTK